MISQKVYKHSHYNKPNNENQSWKTAKPQIKRKEIMKTNNLNWNSRETFKNSLKELQHMRKIYSKHMLFYGKSAQKEYRSKLHPERF